MAKMFQVKLSGEWKNYAKDEDKILKRAFLAGFPNARYTLRKQKYEVNFKDMQQKNLSSGKAREIRPPYKWSQPAKPIVEAGPAFCVKVPKEGPGTTIQVPHPKVKGHSIPVKVPATAKVGQAMLVPVPIIDPAAASSPATSPDAKADGTTKKDGMSTGAKVATGAAVAAGVGGLAVAGAVLGEHIAEEGWDATMAELGDVATDAGEHIVGAAESAGEAIGDAAGDAGEWLSGAAEDAGDFIMDLF
eukprot:TRINITY_DN150_c0_g1_i1.p1 TRINITY_DN150_c0_g1~~TRINITY_DN150_c0_g1_i1.p1  ORF type:complete len:246 (-),score=92.97 TRINITY_DN150_c0_g1_i1:325-1062(-)